MFKIIDDKQVADELWQAGVLWWKYHTQNETMWRLDDTQDTDACAPRHTWDICTYAIRVEE